MPSKFSGTVQERLDHMERIGRRCDANGRSCPNPAVEVYEMIPADGFGNPIQGERIQARKVCGRHRVQFLQNGFWALANRRRIDEDDPATPATAA